MIKKLTVIAADIQFYISFIELYQSTAEKMQDYNPFNQDHYIHSLHLAIKEYPTYRKLRQDVSMSWSNPFVGVKSLVGEQSESRPTNIGFLCEDAEYVFSGLFHFMNPFLAVLTLGDIQNFIGDFPPILSERDMGILASLFEKSGLLVDLPPRARDIPQQLARFQKNAE